MKTNTKQILKAIGYVLLFFGVQLLISFIMQFIYGFQVGMENAVTGTTLDQQALMEGMTEFLAKNSNWMALISGILTIFVLWMVFKIRKKSFCQEVYFCKFDKRKIIPIIILGIAVSFFISCGLSLLPIPESVIEAYMESAKMLTTGSIGIKILSTIVMAPIVEEIIFRGLVLSRLKKAMNVWLAIVLSSLFFGLLHGQLLWIAYTFLFGILLAIVAEASGSVVASILLHMAFNTIGVFAEYIKLSNNLMIIVVFVSLGIGICSLSYILKKDKQQEIFA